MHLKPPRIATVTLIAVIVGVCAVASWLFGTESGLARVLALAGRAPGVAITVRGAHGRLVGGFEIEELVIEHERARIVVRGLSARLDLSGLPLLRILLPSLAARDVAVTAKPRIRPSDHAPVDFVPGPVTVAIGRLTVAALQIEAPGDGSTHLKEIAARVGISRSRIESTAVHADGGSYLVDGRATLLAGYPLGLDAALDFTLRAGERRLRGSAIANGTLAAFVVKAAVLAPRGASFEGTVKLADAPHLDGRLGLDGFDPDALGAATGALTGTLGVAGWVGDFTIDGRIASARVPLGPVAVSAAGGYEHEALLVRRLAVSLPTAAGTPPARLAAVGRIDIGERSRIDLRGDWSGLRWPTAARAAMLTSPSGTFRIAGSGPFAYGLNAALHGPSLPATAVVAQGSVDSERLAVRSFDARLAAGRIAGSGILGFATPHPWTVTLGGRGIDPGAFRGALKGRVNFDADADGEGFDLFGHWDARLKHLDGTVRGLPARGSGTVAARGTELRLDQVKLAFGSAELIASGALGPHADLLWRLRVDRLGDFLPDATGSIRSHGAASGDLAHISARGTLGARELKLGDWRAAQLTAEADLDATDRNASFLRLSALGVAHGAYRADEFRVTLDGKATAHTLVLRLINGTESGELATHGTYRNGVLTLELETLRVSGPPLLAYRLEGPSTLVLALDAASLTRTCIMRAESRICAEGSWSGTRPWAARLEAAALPLRLTGIEMPKDTEYGGSVAMHLDARGAPGHAWTGAGVLEFADAEFRYRASSGRMEQVRLGNGRAEVHANADAYDGSVGLATLGGSYFAGSARIGRGDGPLVEGPLSGVFSMSTTELGALPLFIPGVDRLTGHVETNLTLAGTIAAPLLAGSAHLTSGEIDMHRTNLLLRAIDAQVTLDGDALTLAARAETRGGSATASGRLVWRDRAPAGQFDFTGTRLLVADLPEAKIVASPKLHFTVDRNRITVSGDVAIPSARIAPRDLRQAVIASSDERMVAEEVAPRESALTVDAAVRLVPGDDVTIDAYGLKGKLGGSLLVTARGGEVPFGTGELNVREGKYTAYTRELDIDRGRLLFAGQALGNPGLDIRAQRKLQTVTAGIYVRGTLLAPQISFYSDPAMSQSQIAALLIVGKTLDDIQDPTKTSISGADTRNALVAQGSAVLAGQLGRYVGISDVGVEQGTNKASSVVIGKFLSPRLYVSYGVSLTEAINTLKLRYTVGDRWVIRTESGTRQSVDVEYTIEH